MGEQAGAGGVSLPAHGPVPPGSNLCCCPCRLWPVAVQVEADLRRVFATGWFASVVPDAEDTRDGVKLVVKVGGRKPGRAP